MIKALALMLFVVSFGSQAQSTITRNFPLHLTCVIGEVPFFIELNANHDRALLSVNNYIDHEGRGHSRRFLAEFKRTTIISSELYEFTRPVPKDSPFSALQLTVPQEISRWLGKGNQFAGLKDQDGQILEGKCFVQFPPFPPSF
jgi:hypothetical protein